MSKLGSKRARRASVALSGLVLSMLLVGVALVSSGGSAAATSTVPKNTALPTISGTPVSGQTLSAKPGTWSGTTPITYAYQWQRCSAGATCGDVKGATKQSYELTSNDVGNTIRVAVTAKNSAGSATAASAPTAVVSAPAKAPQNAVPPSINGTPTVGRALTVNTGSWSGTLPISYGYQWYRCIESGNKCAPIAGATGATYTPTTADAGNSLRVVVSAKNAGGSLNVTSAPTVIVTGSVNGCLVGTRGALAVSGVSSPARLVVDKLQFTPSVVTSSTRSVTARFHVSACGRSIQGALVYATAVPYNQFGVPAEVATGADGWATVTMQRLSGFPAAKRQQLLVMFVRARSPHGNVLSGISSRRLVSTRVDLAD